MTKSDLSRFDRTAPDAVADSAFDLRDALAALFRHIRPALLILTAAILGAGIYLLLTPAEYTADAKLIIRLGREKAAAPVQGGANQNYMFSERAQNVNNEVEILREIRALVSELGVPTYVSSSHMSNSMKVGGSLPRHRDELLDSIDDAIEQANEANLHRFRMSIREL